MPENVNVQSSIRVKPEILAALRMLQARELLAGRRTSGSAIVAGLIAAEAARVKAQEADRA